MKPARKSKTMWLNWASTILNVAGIAQLYIPDMGFDLKTTAYLMFGLNAATAVGNMLLRLVTKEGIG